MSSPLTALERHYDVVVVGSGYGGAIAASRLARATCGDGTKLGVCVLERGRELQPGDYPDTLTRVLAETQVDTPSGHFRSRTGLYDFRVNDDVNALVGCGLGGTSLINVNVALQPLPRVFQESSWPTGLRVDTAGLDAGFQRAVDMLGPIRYPAGGALGFPPLQKSRALERAGRYLAREDAPARFEPPPINVRFTDGLSPAGVTQHACQLCGDCMTGCNYGAKNTLLMNYLPDAKANGAQIFTEVSVKRLERSGDRWLVHYEVLDAGRERFEPPEMSVSANFVILAAGTLGSTEILLRSQERGLGGSRLTLSGQIGRHFSVNGDMLALGYNTDEPINAVGAGRFRPNPGEPVGPCITGMIDMRGRRDLTDDMVIQEGSIPGALASLMPAVLGGAVLLFGGDTRASVRKSLGEEARRLLKYLRGPYHGAVRNTQIFLVMGHDGAGGRMHLRHDRLRIEWPGAGEQKIFAEAERRLRTVTRELGGTYLKNPFNLITVHPLGGCRMAESADAGVVDHKGQVFSTCHGTEVCCGLYVCDGSIIPRSLGVNPLLTISALAERLCDLMARRHGWTIRYL